MRKVLGVVLCLVACNYVFGQCPVINGAMVNSCGGSEGINEFVIFTTTASATAGSYTLYYGSNNPPSGGPTGQMWGTTASTKTGTGNITATGGCAIVQVTSSSITIPANSTVIFIPSDFEAQYDVSSLCNGGSIYVVYINRVSPSVWSAGGTLANSPSGNRYIQVTNGANACTGNVRSYGNNWGSNTDGNALWWNASGTPTYSNDGCSVVAPPTPTISITPAAPVAVCINVTSTTMAYTATGNPNQYSLDWNAAAQTAGFTDIVNAPLTASPITINIPAGVPAGTYTASLTARNTTTSLTTTPQNITVTINDVPTVNNISGANIICAGATTTLSNTTPGGTWNSNNTAVATVNSSGVVTGVAGGTATITYTVSNSCGSASKTFSITVNDKPTVANITGDNALCVPATTILANTTPGGTWSSSNTAVATVDATGTVTAVAMGMATISYSVSNSCGATVKTFTITINDKPNVPDITGPNTVQAGATITLSNVMTSGAWGSSDATIATIDANGVVTGISAGTVTISYTIINNSCGSVVKTFTITVLPSSGNVFIPNTFTPNNDGLNDFFYVYGNGIKSVQLRVFNQWGQLIFDAKDASLKWDGTYKGKKQPVGVYVYVAKVLLLDGKEINSKGAINLIR